MTVVPITLAEANEFVRQHHRHHAPVTGCKFCVAVADDDGQVRGVAIVGRPVARLLDDGWTLEVNRTCTALYQKNMQAINRAVGKRLKP